MFNLFTVDYIAQLIGQYALTFITLVTILVLFGIVIFWQIFNENSRWLWQTGYYTWDRLTSSPSATRLWQTNPRFWKFLGQRLSPKGYLGLHLTLGFLISLVAFLAFGGIAAQVVETQGVVRFDQQLATALYHNVNELEVALFHHITNLGGRGATIVLGFGIGFLLLFLRRRLLLISWIVAILGNSALNAILKLTFQRARPTFDEPVLTETFYSFPSGHAMGSVIIYGMLVYLYSVLLADSRWKRVLVVCLAVWIVLFIGFSRMYLGVHYFSDIVAGYIAGTGWLVIVITGTEVARRRKIRQLLRI